MSDLEAAFRRASDARQAIASVIDQVESGDTDLATAFASADNDPLTGRCFAVKVFEVVPGVGKVRARRAMAEIGLADDIWLVDVPAAERAQIITALAGTVE